MRSRALPQRPCDLAALVSLDLPVVRVHYRFEERGGRCLDEHLEALAAGIGTLAACLVVPSLVVFDPTVMLRVLVFALAAAALGERLGAALPEDLDVRMDFALSLLALGRERTLARLNEVVALFD